MGFRGAQIRGDSDLYRLNDFDFTQPGAYRAATELQQKLEEAQAQNPDQVPQIQEYAVLLHRFKKAYKADALQR